MRDKGWNVEVEDDGMVTPEGIPVDQNDQFNADSDECAASFGYDQPPPQLTRQEAAELYDTLIEVATCIEDLGYPVPEPPSQQAFVEARMAEAIPPWHPYEALVEIESSTERRRVEEACPVPS